MTKRPTRLFCLSHFVTVIAFLPSQIFIGNNNRQIPDTKDMNDDSKDLFTEMFQSDANSDGIHCLKPYRNLAGARQDPTALLVMTADVGGTVMLTVPLYLVYCSTQTLQNLAEDLDAFLWRAPQYTSIIIMPTPPNNGGVPGGMGGGRVTGELWLHPRLPLEIFKPVQDILFGLRQRLKENNAV